MVSNAAYRIIKKAVALRVKNGEVLEEVVEEYTKLSEEQKAQIIEELSAEE